MRTLLVLVGVLGLVAMTGCNGVARTADERKFKAKQALDMDMRQIADDWDRIWLADRQYRLTRWQMR